MPCAQRWRAWVSTSEPFVGWSSSVPRPQIDWSASAAFGSSQAGPNFGQTWLTCTQARLDVANDVAASFKPRWLLGEHGAGHDQLVE